MPGIPLDEIFASANSLRTAGLIVDYALGEALAAVRYTEPFTTYDADIFFIPADRGLTAGIPAIYAQSPETSEAMTLEMRRVLARLPYEEKLRRVAELIEFSRAFRQSAEILSESNSIPVQTPGGREFVSSTPKQV